MAQVTPEPPKFDVNTGQPIQRPAAKFDVHTGQPIQPVPPPGVQMQPMTQQPVMYQPGIAETTYTWDLPPEKEYDVTPCYHECSTCGGKQKIKLYKDDIAFEQTCARPSHRPCVCNCIRPSSRPLTAAHFLCIPPPNRIVCPWPLVFPLPFWIMAWLLSGQKSTTRKSYREIQGIDLTNGSCCGAGDNADCTCCGDPCCGPTYKINGLTLLPREHRGHISTLKEMLSEISTRSNAAKLGRRDGV